ncbi:type II/IV secretion system protein [Candidatus Collierbacteria bacterium]|nr:type II/IV secretion system protein [Candidatus Collierbacteria bacterium]
MDLISVLAESGKLTADQVAKARVQIASSNKPQLDIVKELGVSDDEVLSKAQASVWGIPYFDQDSLVLSPELLNLVPKSVADTYKVVPFSYDSKNGVLTVVMSNPQDLSAIDFLEKRTGARVVVQMTSVKRLEALIDQNYAQSLIGEVTEVLKKGEEDEDETSGVITAESMARIIKEPKIVEIVKKVLEYAIKFRATDVHIEPLENITRIRYRIDGILEERLRLDRQYHAALVSRIKILGGMKIDEKRMPQDGRFAFKSDLGEVDLRISSLPTAHGEKIVMRLLPKSQKIPTLQELGLRGKALKNLEEAVLIPHGIILITGPTGSGKTTTLYSLISKINSSKVNIVTLEDPIEYQMHGVNQVQINPQAGLTFASGLRSFLRQDPNIIMVGEIRDEETAELAIQASLTGHLVFSTLHTNSAAGALPRLIDMKAEPFLLASSMTAIVAQRVLRKICENCKGAYVPDPTVVADVKAALGDYFLSFVKGNPEMSEEAKKQGAEFLLYKGKGCDKCEHIGYLGRVAIFEVLPVSSNVAKMIMQRSDAAAIEKLAVSEGMLLMKQDGYIKVLEGTTTIEEVLRVAQI